MWNSVSTYKPASQNRDTLQASERVSLRAASAENGEELRISNTNNNLRGEAAGGEGSADALNSAGARRSRALGRSRSNKVSLSTDLDAVVESAALTQGLEHNPLHADSSVINEEDNSVARASLTRNTELGTMMCERDVVGVSDRELSVCEGRHEDACSHGNDAKGVNRGQFKGSADGRHGSHSNHAWQYDKRGVSRGKWSASERYSSHGSHVGQFEKTLNRGKWNTSGRHSDHGNHQEQYDNGLMSETWTTSGHPRRSGYHTYSAGRQIYSVF